VTVDGEEIYCSLWGHFNDLKSSTPGLSSNLSTNSTTHLKVILPQ